MNKIKLIAILLILTSMSYGQGHPWQVKFSHEIESGVADGSIRPSKAGTLYSFIGKYHESTIYSDIPVSWGIDSVQVSGYEIIEALPAIITAAQEHQLVIISENHLKPQHRIFAKQIITELSQHGFEHLGLETFANINNSNSLVDAELVKRGYPLDTPMTGTYTLEPRMAELVREAISLDYNLFAYERSQKIEGLDRDEILADNIIRYIEQHPDEKIIILCGFHHAIESDLPKRVKHQWMAKYLKDKTGLDPLTIYQDNFTEKFSEDEHPFLREATVTTPCVFVDQKGNLVRLSNHVDIEVIHPKTWYKNGRPNWLYETKEYTSYEVDLQNKEIKYPCLVSAYLIGEENGVPVDRIEVKHKYDNRILVLKKGEHLIKVTDSNTEIQFQTEVYLK